MLEHVVQTFFSGSMPEAAATLLSESDLSEDEIDRLSQIIRDAMEEGC